MHWIYFVESYLKGKNQDRGPFPIDFRCAICGRSIRDRRATVDRHKRLRTWFHRKHPGMFDCRRTSEDHEHPFLPHALHDCHNKFYDYERINDWFTWNWHEDETVRSSLIPTLYAQMQEDVFRARAVAFVHILGSAVNVKTCALTQNAIDIMEFLFAPVVMEENDLTDSDIDTEIENFDGHRKRWRT